MKHLAKTFGPTQALVDASFDLHVGEVHALVGENGSGKSTLVKILSGVHAPDRGTLDVCGTSIESPPSPRAAHEKGVQTVFQEVLVAEGLSVLENVWLGSEGLVRSRRASSERRSLALDAFRELLGRDVDLDSRIENLALSDRQACCIVRAVLRRPRILVLDEATSALDIATRDRLFAIVRRLCEDGGGVIFITHRLDEINEIGDRLTVLRSGRTVATLQQQSWSARQIVRLMTGADRLVQQERPPPSTAGRPVLTMKDVTLLAGRKAVQVQIRSGELLGVAGLEGHGQEEFLDAIRGARSGGDVLFHRTGAVNARVASTADAADNGIFYVPRERRSALFGWMSVRENFGLPTLRRDAWRGWLDVRSTERRFARYVTELGIVVASANDAIPTLSGGNQQKVLLARWLAAEPQVLLLCDPTRGIDISTKQQLYLLLGDLTSRGVTVVMSSSEVDEHVELMDRVLVFREHELFVEIERSHLSRTALVSAYFGQEAHGPDA